MDVSVAIDGKTNYEKARSNQLVVFDVALLAFLLKKEVYRPIIEATKSSKGQQLFVPYVYDIIKNKKLSLVKVFPKDAVWVETEDFKGKTILEFQPTNDVQRNFQAHWVEVNRIFTAEMLRMQETLLNGRGATEYTMVGKDKITKMSVAIKEKYGEHVEGRDYHACNLSMVYFMEAESGFVVGVVLQESFSINPLYKAGGKRKSEVLEEPAVKDPMVVECSSK